MPRSLKISRMNFTFGQSIVNFKFFTSHWTHLSFFSFTAILNLMLGSSTSEQSDRKFDAKVWKFVTIVKQLFETSSKLMSIPVNFADKIQMKAYRDFEDAAHGSIAICKNFQFFTFFSENSYYLQHEISFPF